jgi:hypothetical protein
MKINPGGLVVRPTIVGRPCTAHCSPRGVVRDCDEYPIGAERQYQRAIGPIDVMRDSLAMNKRVIIFALWFYAAWTCGALIAGALGMNGLIGPVAGAVVASLVVFRPLKVPTARR